MYSFLYIIIFQWYLKKIHYKYKVDLFDTIFRVQQIKKSEPL